MIHTEPPRTTPRPGTTRRATIPISSLVAELKDELATLFSTTTQLLRQELQENADNAVSALRSACIGVGIIGVGALMALLAVDLILIAILAPTFMAYETAAWVATSSLAAILLISGIIIAKKNKDKLKTQSFVPHKTLQTVEEHAEWIGQKAGELTR